MSSDNRFTHSLESAFEIYASRRNTEVKSTEAIITSDKTLAESRVANGQLHNQSSHIQKDSYGAGGRLDSM